MRKPLRALIPLVLGLALAGPVEATPHSDKAQAVLKDADGNRVGEVRLLDGPNGTLVRAEFDGLPEGEHAFHVHAVGECTPPFKSAGGHFNPGGFDHGFASPGGYHAGDMPNLHVPESGELRVAVFNPRLGLDDKLFDEDGAAIVIHEGADDYATDPAGAAGPRIACGVLRR